ncbi:MAG: aldehyde dehydrogenase EutE [Tissierellia bacterium]|nr:aldehyde dehydrogenase EutE [Tissierellia bacterium]
MKIEQSDIQLIIDKVMERLDNINVDTNSSDRIGVFDDPIEAIKAAKKAQKKLFRFTLQQKKDITDSIRKELLEHVEEFAVEAVKETGMGRIEDKIEKNKAALSQTPGVEDLRAGVFTGDAGLTLLEMSPFGVIGAITPSTNPTETVINNSIGMICAGNSVVFSPHPGAYKITNRTVELINKAIQKAGGPANLVVTIDNPSMEKADVVLSHPDINMLVATGGPGVVKSVLSSGKKAIGAGAGNPPVVVDHTADIEKAVDDIIMGASFDNNLPCTSEKEALVLDDVFEYFMFCMKDHQKTYVVEDKKIIEDIRKLVILENGNPNKNFTGKYASYILDKVGIQVDDSVRLIVMETDFDHDFVQEELMMPILPIVRVANRKEALEKAILVEHGNRHTAICHSKDIDFLSAMAKEIQTTIFVKNAPSFAGIGIGGEGYTTFTIAGPTGEGLTSASSFTRKRRCTLVEGFNIK